MFGPYLKSQAKKINSLLLPKGDPFAYIFGSLIESGVKITHSVLKRKHVKNLSSEEKGSEVVKVRYVIPNPEGKDAVEDL